MFFLHVKLFLKETIMYHKIIYLSIFLIATSSPVIAQSTSLPLLSNGKTEFAMTTQGGFSESYANGDRIRIYGAFVRFGIGFHKMFDVYSLIGSSKQNIRHSDTSLSNFDSGMARTLGGGLAIQWPFKLPWKLKLSSTGQMVVFSPTGAAYSRSTVPNTNYRKRHDFTYEWRHTQVATFAARQFRHYEFFIGGELIINSVDFKRDLTLESDEGTFFLSSSRGVYLEESRPNLSLGLNIALPGRHHLGFELKGGTDSDVAIFIAIGQTGKP
ncbi:MAG: hypothetical protein DWQ05_08500 [Calditrichaeota bacterium]|nr:MAG: hypothetical protein DWQ05_08500 [Calditrichota bacterium]